LKPEEIMNIKQDSNEVAGGGSALNDMLDTKSIDKLVCEIRRQANQRNSTWPCILLKDLVLLCDEYDRLKLGA
jgi:hypothetical protein